MLCFFYAVTAFVRDAKGTLSFMTFEKRSNECVLVKFNIKYAYFNVNVCCFMLFMLPRKNSRHIFHSEKSPKHIKCIDQKKEEEEFNPAAYIIMLCIDVCFYART